MKKKDVEKMKKEKMKKQNIKTVEKMMKLKKKIIKLIML